MPNSIHASPSFHIFYASFHKDITYEKLQDETTKHFPIINLSNKQVHDICWNTW